MVSNGEKSTKGMGKWFFKTMAKRPSTWVGLGVGGLIFSLAVGTIGPVGAMFMGGIAGFTAGAFTFLIHAGIAASYLKSNEFRSGSKGGAGKGADRGTAPRRS